MRSFFRSVKRMQDTQAFESLDARGKILNTACRLFSQQGYEITSLSQVAREAKVSKALILWHFDTKENLFEKALRKTVEPYFITVDDLEGLDERAQIGSLIEQFYDFVRDNVYSVRFFLSLMLREEKEPGDILTRISELYGVFRNLIADVIARGQQAGVFRSVSTPQLDAALIMATMAGILVQQFIIAEQSTDPKALLEHLKSTVLQRLGA